MANHISTYVLQMRIGTGQSNVENIYLIIFAILFDKYYTHINFAIILCTHYFFHNKLDDCKKVEVNVK